jgi:hypothetical protein
MRPSLIYSDQYILFKNKIEPDDVKQGLDIIGDSTFLSIVASLANNELRIKKLFLPENEEVTL